MNDLFQLVFEYRVLLAQRRAAGLQLSSPARQRLDALHRLLRREPSEGDESMDYLGRRRHARCETGSRAVWRSGAQMQAVEVVNLGAGGVGIVSDEPVDAGLTGVLSLGSPAGDMMYECNVRVSWTTVVDGQYQAGLRFVGAPLPALLAS